VCPRQKEGRRAGRKQDAARLPASAQSGPPEMRADGPNWTPLVNPFRRGSGDSPDRGNPFRRGRGGEGEHFPREGTTGRYLILLRPGAVETAVRILGQSADVKVSRAADFGSRAVDAAALGSAEAIVFDDLEVVTVSTDPDQLLAIMTAGARTSAVLAIEPERIVEAIEPAVPASALSDESAVTWGLQRTRAVSSRYTGRGVRLAVLDTGLDLQHPDFADRQIVSQSFVAGQDVQDGHGHGTHVAGTACGPATPSQPPRYGVAVGAAPYIAKVLSDQGRGNDSAVLAGIQWAITNGCAIISMSLGTPLCDVPEQPFSRVFESVARRALWAGCLIIAAAGNDSARPGRLCPISHPANCPSIMAVGAVDESLQIASFSNTGLVGEGGQVDIVGPGVSIHSAWPSPRLYQTVNGTSMATPHVSGLAALHAEANPFVRGGALGWLLLGSASRLSAQLRDVGAGLAQAP